MTTAEKVLCPKCKKNQMDPKFQQCFECSQAARGGSPGASRSVAVREPSNIVLPTEPTEYFVDGQKVSLMIDFIQAMFPAIQRPPRWKPSALPNSVLPRG